LSGAKRVSTRREKRVAALIDQAANVLKSVLICHETAYQGPHLRRRLRAQGLKCRWRKIGGGRHGRQRISSHGLGGSGEAKH
jgi:hypothetical protein